MPGAANKGCIRRSWMPGSGMRSPASPSRGQPVRWKLGMTAGGSRNWSGSFIARTRHWPKRLPCMVLSAVCQQPQPQRGIGRPAPYVPGAVPWEGRSGKDGVAVPLPSGTGSRPERAELEAWRGSGWFSTTLTLTAVTDADHSIPNRRAFSGDKLPARNFERSTLRMR